MRIHVNWPVVQAWEILPGGERAFSYCWAHRRSRTDEPCPDCAAAAARLDGE